MTNIRIIPRLDIKGPNLIKGVHLEGLRVIGDPQEYAIKYYEHGADELLYMDIVASLYGRNNLDDIVKRTVDKVFIPITVGGGIRSVEDAVHMLRCGADKVAINTAAVNNPELVSLLARKLGSQAVVVSIEAISCGAGKWEAYTDNGREKTGLDVVEWAKEVEKRGAGEILLTSIDREGTRKGYDIELTKQVAQAVSIPVIACGGMGVSDDLVEVIKSGKADAVSMADILHYDRETLAQIRSNANNAGLNVRSV